MKHVLRVFFALPLWAALVGLGGCSVNKLAISAVSDALGGDGSGGGGTTEVFSSDSDPELVADSLPFAIKMYETLLAGNQEHLGLLVTTGSLFVMYANAFVQSPADILPASRFEERDALKSRAKALYLRGVEILNRALEKRFPASVALVAGGAGEADLVKLERLLGRAKKGDVSLLYWTVAGTLAAYAIDPLDLNLGIRLRALKLLIDRAYALDPDYSGGTLDEFYALYYAAVPPELGGDKVKAREHFERALEKTGGLSAGPYVAWAENVAVPAQDYALFRDCLEAALAIDVNVDVSRRLVNIISQRKARYLLDNGEYYFVDIDGVFEGGAGND